MPLSAVKWVDLPVFADERGSLSVIQGNTTIPFSIARVFYIYRVAQNAIRGGHAHYKTQQLVLSIAGSFVLELTDGVTTQTYSMNDPARAVYIPPMIWDRLSNFSEDAICMVLASEPYDEADYVRDWGRYLSEVNLVQR